MRFAVVCLASALALVACSRKPASQAASSSPSEAGPAAASAPAAAPGGVFAPHRRAGLWQLAIDASGGPGVRMRAQMCVDASTDKDFGWHGPHSPSQNCEKTQMRPVMGGFSFDSVCHAGSRTITSHGTVTGDLDKAYNVDVATRMTPPGPGGMGEMKSQIKARWLGPCPPGMKAGVIKMAGVSIGR